MSESKSKTESRAPRLVRKSSRSSPFPGGNDLAAGLLVSLAERWHVFERQVERARRRPSESAIHDLRVATRRLIAALDILRALSPGADLASMRQALKRQLRAFSAVRDLQVQIIAVRALVHQFPVLRRLGPELKRRERSLLKQARRETIAIRLPALEKNLSTIEDRFELLIADPSWREASTHVVLGTLGQAYAHAAELKTLATTGKIGRIHRFRISFKKLRYTVEALQRFLPGVNLAVLKGMNAYQTRMGEIQDSDVLLGTVNALARRQNRLAPLQWLGVKIHLINRRKEQIADFIANAGEFDSFWARFFSSHS